LKKSSITSNIVLVYLSGGLILYVLFRYLMKKKINPNSTQDQGLTFGPTPTKAQLTYQEVFDWIRSLESVKYRAYPDGKDRFGKQLYSIGMGHQIQPGEEYLFNRTITEQEVRDLFKKDSDLIIKDIESAIIVPVNRNQKLAMFSIRYNVGPSGFRRGTLLSTLNSGNYSGTAAIIPSFITTSNGGIFNQGLRNRREKEKDLFIKPV